MQYRRFGNLDFQVSALGFGCMRLPTQRKDGPIDEPAAIAMIRHAIDHGVNYVDTAYPYHGGDSERLLAKALADGYRQKIKQATKMPAWMVNTTHDLDRLFNEQLERMQTDHLDFYLLHNLHGQVWRKMRNVGALPWLEKQRAAGRIGEIGFSFHDRFEVFKEIVDGYDGWALAQIQYNYLCEDVQAGTRGLEYAARRGLAVVIMEPLFGGTLANPPGQVRRIWDEARLDPVDVALRWLWDKPEVAVVLSGMSNFDQVKQNVAVAASARIGALKEAERQVLARVRQAYEALSPVPCTRCGYCQPCPHGVDIPGNFELYNGAVTQGGNAQSLNHNLYGQMPAEKRADKCVACRECEAKCPQRIAIGEWLPKVHAAMGK